MSPTLPCQRPKMYDLSNTPSLQSTFLAIKRDQSYHFHWAQLKFCSIFTTFFTMYLHSFRKNPMRRLARLIRCSAYTFQIFSPRHINCSSASHSADALHWDLITISTIVLKASIKEVLWRMRASIPLPLAC